MLGTDARYAPEDRKELSTPCNESTDVLWT